ncbi:MAG: lysophospholipid acyltransferase family protein [Pseudomonadota bacterium]
MLKKLLQSPAAVWLLGRVAALYIRLVYRTTRWERAGWAEAEAARSADEAGVLCFWHGRIAESAAVWRDRRWSKDVKRDVTILISSNRDGAVIASAMKPFDIDVVRGSATNKKKAQKAKGGVSAFRSLIKTLRSGKWAAITPDGPRGPRMRAQAGVAALAATTGAPVLPLGWSVTNGKLLGSWDRFLLPRPFGRGAIVFGPLVRPEPGARSEADIEALRRRIEEGLIAATQEADRLLGRTPVEPDPEPAPEPAPDTADGRALETA